MAMSLRVVLVETRDILSDDAVRAFADDIPSADFVSFDRLSDALELPPSLERMVVCVGFRLLDETILAKLQRLLARQPKATLLMARGIADLQALRSMIDVLETAARGDTLPPRQPAGWPPAGRPSLRIAVSQSPAAPLPRLSERETQIVLLLREGLQNKLIARRLDLSVSTVKSHVANIFRKIGADNRLDAICKFAALNHAAESDPLLSFGEHMLANRTAAMFARSAA
jgi:DNA-binding CsgD family transcriptional regulator